MKNPQIVNQVSQFCQEWQAIYSVYDDFARTVDISYTSLQILNIITDSEECTQKLICEQTFLPKQTV